MDYFELPNIFKCQTHFNNMFNNIIKISNAVSHNRWKNQLSAAPVVSLPAARYALIYLPLQYHH